MAWNIETCRAWDGRMIPVQKLATNLHECTEGSQAIRGKEVSSNPRFRDRVLATSFRRLRSSPAKHGDWQEILALNSARGDCRPSRSAAPFDPSRAESRAADPGFVAYQRTARITPRRKGWWSVAWGIYHSNRAHPSSPESKDASEGSLSVRDVSDFLDIVSWGHSVLGIASGLPCPSFVTRIWFCGFIPWKFPVCTILHSLLSIRAVMNKDHHHLPPAVVFEGLLNPASLSSTRGLFTEM